MAEQHIIPVTFPRVSWLRPILEVLGVRRFFIVIILGNANWLPNIDRTSDPAHQDTDDNYHTVAIGFGATILIFRMYWRIDSAMFCLASFLSWSSDNQDEIIDKKQQKSFRVDRSSQLLARVKKH